MKTKNRTETIESTEIVISSGVPIPAARWSSPKYPWRDMRPGDSFFVPGERRLVVSQARKKSIGFTPISRKVVEGGTLGYRYWRP